MTGPSAGNPSCATGRIGWSSWMTRLRGRSAVGERLFGTTLFGRWKTLTFIAGLTCDALVTPWVIEGAMDRTAFASTSRPGSDRPYDQAPS